MTGDKKQKMMLEKPVHVAICRLAVPSIISMLVTAFYNMADAYFVGSVGGDSDSSATAAIGIAFALMSVIQAIGFFFGHGSGTYISHKLGADETDKAEQMSSVGFGLSLIFGILITLLGLIFIKPLSLLLGATPTSLDFVKEYVGIILIGAPFMCSSCVLNNQLRFQGSALYGMIGLASGAVLNIGLDWLFIIQLNMQVKGAAVATVISQTVSFFLLVLGTLHKGNLRVRISRFKPTFALFKEIAKCGTPSLFRQGLSSLATICLNMSAANAAVASGVSMDDAISAMSIASRVMFFVGATVIGFGQGFQPVCGFNYGAKKYDRVLSAFWFCVRFSAIYLIIVTAIGSFFAGDVIALFKDNPDVIRFGSTALKFQLMTHPIMAFVVISNMMTQNLGMVVKASVIAMARQGVFLMGSVLILPLFFNMWGVVLAQPVADILTFLLTLFMMIPILKQLKALSDAQIVSDK